MESKCMVHRRAGEIERNVLSLNFADHTFVKGPVVEIRVNHFE